MSSNILSLEELSLNKIRDNFSYYVSSYRSTKNENLKKCLLFLQRRYTQKLFDMLDESEKLKKEHLDFLLNEYLHELDIDSLLSLLKKEAILEKVIPIAHNLHELLCYNLCNIYDSRFLLKRLIPHSPNVKRVIIVNCNDKLLKLIVSSCPALIELDIHCSTVTGKGLKALFMNSDGLIQARCPIKLLNLLKTPLEVNDVAFLLKHMPTLEEVLYDKLPSAIESSYLLEMKASIFQDSVKYNLQSLNLSDYDYEVPSDLSRALTIFSETCPKLKKLSVHIFKIEDLNLISGFSELEYLALWGPDPPSQIAINDFLACRGKELKHLSITSVSLSLSTLVDNCPNLETLELCNIVYQDHLEKSSLKLLNQLRNLELSAFSQEYLDTDSSMKLLSTCPNLETLSFSWDLFYENAFEEKLLQFSLNCNVKHLEFTFSNAAFSFIRQFTLNCDSIVTLTLDYCENIDSHMISSFNRIIKEYNRTVAVNFTECADDWDNDHRMDFDDLDEGWEPWS